MRPSIALVTGTTSGLGYAAASMLAAEGSREVIVTGRSLTRVHETAAQLAAETKTQVFTALELDLDAPTSVQSALAELIKRGRPIDFLLLNAGMVPGKKRVLTAPPAATSEFGVDASGQFFASAPKKLTGPIEAMRHPHLHDRASQEAAWQAVVKVSGVDVSSAAPLSAES